MKKEVIGIGAPALVATPMLRFGSAVPHGGVGLRHSAPVAVRFCTAMLATWLLVGCTARADAEVEPEDDLHPGLEQGDLAGTWEGEFLTPRRPIFMTLELEHGEERWRGSIVALGGTHVLHEVVPRADGVTAVLVPGPQGFTVEAVLEDDRLIGTVTEAGQAFPLELVRIPAYPEPGDREAAWLQDLDALRNRFLRFDRSFTPEERSLFVERIDDLRTRVPEAADSELMMRMSAAVALSGNAHTRLYLLRNRTELRRLPVRVWWFGEDLHVVRATSRHRDLLGCRVDAIEDTRAGLVRDSVAAAFAGNSSWTDYKSVYYMSSPDALHGFRIAADPERVEFSFSGCRPEAFRRSLAPLPLDRSEDPVEAWWDLSPRHREAGWAHVLVGSAAALPLYLRHPDRHYWFQYLEDPRLLYFQYNRASQMEEESVADFGDRLLAELERRDFQAFVLDLRFNTGGSLGLAEGLMAELEERTRNIPRFVITGRATFSAGIAHVVAWREAGRVLVVGEEIGDHLDYWSEGGNIILPNSDLTAHFANAFHSYSEEQCPEDVPCFLDLSSPDPKPDVATSTSWMEYAAGRDPAMDAVGAAVNRF